jgi:hypothetical protein
MISGIAQSMDAPHTIIGTDPGWGSLRALSRDMRLRHMAVFGATGVGKSTFLLNLIAQDLARGDGLVVIDPHGALAEDALELVPSWRQNHVCALDLGDLAHPIGMNLVDDVHRDHRATVADGVLAAMRAIWHESWGPRLEEILRHSLMVLIEAPATSIVLLPRLLTDAEFRARMLTRCSAPLTLAFFEHRFNVWRDTDRDMAISPVLNKVEAFLFSPAVLHTLGQATSTLDLVRMMQKPRVIIANLAKGKIGESAAHLMGALLISRVQNAAMARGSGLPDWHLIIDEAQNFPTEALSSLLSEARKFGVSITAATQYTDAMPPTVRAALLGNAGTLISFRVGVEDAARIAPQFNRLHQDFSPAALQELGRGQAFMREAGDDTHPVEMAPPPERTGRGPVVRAQSQRHFSRPRAMVERNIINALRN